MAVETKILFRFRSRFRYKVWITRTKWTEPPQIFALWEKAKSPHPTAGAPKPARDGHGLRSPQGESKKHQNLDQNSKKIGVLVKVLRIFLVLREKAG